MNTITIPGWILAIFFVFAGIISPQKTINAQDKPGPRAHHELVYHAGEQLVYLIGGSTRRGDTYHYYDEMWYWADNRWSQAKSLPFPRSSHRVIYNSERNSLILFGGGFQRAIKAEGVFWEWGGSEWRAVGGNYQSGKDEPGVCYDETRNNVVIFGGWNRSVNYTNDTWEFGDNTYAKVDTSGPGARAGHMFVYDSVRKNCLLFGGRGPDGYFSDTWEWNGNNWTRLDVAGPSPRWFFGSATDFVNERIVIFGGNTPDGDSGETWTWDGSTWELLNREGPSARGMAKLAFDGDSIILFGGRTVHSNGFVDHNDTWMLQDSTWVKVQ